LLFTVARHECSGPPTLHSQSIPQGRRGRHLTCDTPSSQYS
jgi:hypothetical protein